MNILKRKDSTGMTPLRLAVARRAMTSFKYLVSMG